MLREAQQEYTEIDIAAENKVDPFATDKVVKLEQSKEAVARSAEAIRYGETLMDALELSETFRAELEQYAIDLEISVAQQGKKNVAVKKPAKPTPSLKFLGRNIFEHMELHLKRVRSAELENTLRFLNQKQCFQLLFYLEHMLRHKIEAELVARCSLYILKTYQVQLRQASQEIVDLVKSLSVHLRHHFKHLKTSIGENSCAIKLFEKELRSSQAAANDLDFSKPTEGDTFMF